MADFYARNIVTSNGVDTRLPITFPYADTDHVTVYVDGGLYNGSVSFLSPTLLALSPQPSSGALMEARRETPFSLTERAIPYTFQRGAIDSVQLNQVNVADLYRAQELSDQNAAMAQQIALLAGDTLLGLARPPEFFGAIAGSTSDLIAALNVLSFQRAAESGRRIDGNGQSYRVFGQMRPNVLPKWANIEFVQAVNGAAAAGMQNTLLLDGFTGRIELENIKVDLNGHQPTGGMNQCTGVRITNHTGPVRVKGLALRNGGGITGLKISAPSLSVNSDVVLEDYECYDFTVTKATAGPPPDDVCQGLAMELVKGFRIQGLNVRDMSTSWPSMPVIHQQYSRGAVFGQCKDGQMSDFYVARVEQGVDVTSSSNERIQITDGTIEDAGTWGLKCANFFNDISVRNVQIIRPGFGAVVLSAGSGGGFSGNVELSDLTIRDPGASGLYSASADALGPDGPTGIIIYGRDIATTGYPDGVVIKDCSIEDTQVTKTMVWGIQQRQVNSSPPGPSTAFPALPNRNRNVELDNVIRGAIQGPSFGMHMPRCRLLASTLSPLAGNATLVVPNTGVFQTVTFLAADVEDSAAMHDPGSSPTQLFAFMDGDYLSRMQLAFTPVAGGILTMRAQTNGGARQVGLCSVRTDDAIVAVMSPEPIRMVKGDYIEFQVAYSGTGSLTVNLRQLGASLTAMRL